MPPKSGTEREAWLAEKYTARQLARWVVGLESMGTPAPRQQDSARLATLEQAVVRLLDDAQERAGKDGYKLEQRRLRQLMLEMQPESLLGV